MICAVALGSNLGDRHAHLDYAVSRLRASLDSLNISRYYETEPVGGPGHQPLFLNAAAVGETTRSRAVLAGLLDIERSAAASIRERLGRWISI